MLEDKTQELMVSMQAVLPLIVINALSALGAIVILLIGLWLSGKADQRARTSCARSTPPDRRLPPHHHKVTLFRIRHTS
jgi:hypothetical protein